MLFTELYKNMVNKVTFVGFRGVAPLDRAVHLICWRMSSEQSFGAHSLYKTANNFVVVVPPNS